MPTVRSMNSRLLYAATLAIALLSTVAMADDTSYAAASLSCAQVFTDLAQELASIAPAPSSAH